MMLIVVLVAAYGVPVMAQQTSSGQPKEGTKGVTKPKKTEPPQSSAQQQPDKQKVKAPTSQAEKQKAEKERAKTMKELDKAVKKTDSDIHKNRAKTSMTINRGQQTLLVGE